MTVKELHAYRERMARQFAVISEAESLRLADREASGKLMVRVGKGHRVVTTRGHQRGVNGNSMGVKERGWNGVPQSVPADAYPNKPRVVKRTDLTVPHTTVSRPVAEVPTTIPYIAQICASDIQGRQGRAEKSERIMREALKGYSNRV